MQNVNQFLAIQWQAFDIHAVRIDIAFLVVALLVAVVVDVREHRIPNWLVAIGMTVGILFHACAPQGAGSLFALTGLGIGIATLFPLFALGLLGAGDVKLIGMVGAFLGFSNVLSVILASMAAGGVLAICMASIKRMLPQLLANLRLMLVERHIRQMSGTSGSVVSPPPSIGQMPYALAICAGTLLHLFVLH